MPADDAERVVPEQREPEQPADPFEPEAPAHVDPDAETPAHRVADEPGVDEAEPAPPQPD